MASKTSARDTSDRTRSDLAVLVEAEARLDRQLADARARAAALQDEAERRAAQAAAAVAAAIETERTRIAVEIERDTHERVRAIEQAAHDDVARFDAIRDDRAATRAREVAEQLVALVREEARS